MAQRKILVVEDERSIAEAVADRLGAEGFAVSIAGDGPSAVTMCAELNPDLVVLDLMLPGFDGLEVCRRIQADKPVPVIMLTARDSETDKLVGLGVGADDYMTKPFSVRELVARIYALLRRIERTTTSTGGPVHMGDITIDPARRRVVRNDEEVHLTVTEFDLLHTFASRPGVIFTREQLMRDVWGYDDPTGERTVDSHIASLRRKLGPDTVRTVHGVGYGSGQG
jgi:DNA-binding response OmpR family regulator